MKKQIIRLVSLFLVLTVLLSFAGLTASAEDDDKLVTIGENLCIDMLASDKSVKYNAKKNTLTIKSGNALHLVYTGDTTEETVITWSSSRNDVATIDANGFVTTGSACRMSISAGLLIPLLLALAEQLLQLGILSTPMLLLSIPLFADPQFKGETDLTIQIDNAPRQLHPTMTVHLVVEHTFGEWLVSLFK